MKKNEKDKDLKGVALDTIKALTLIELMFTTVIIGIVVLGAVGIFINCGLLNETARNLTVGMNGAQEKLEQMRNHDFTTMVGAYSPGGSEGNTFLVGAGSWLHPADQRGVIYILDPQTQAILNTNPAANPGLRMYSVCLLVCWRHKSGRISGEDSNLNGALDAGEDRNGNNRIDSPAQIDTHMVER